MANATEEIAIKLGIKTGDLKAALADAGASIKKFKKDGEGGGDSFTKSLAGARQSIAAFRSVLAGAGLVGLLKTIFDAAVTYAENYTGALDENVAATLRVRDAQKDLQNIVGKAGAAVVGMLEKFGLAVGSVVYGVDAAADAMNKMSEETKKAFDDARAKKLLEATTKLEAARRDGALAAASDGEKINILAREYVKLLTDQGKLKKGSIEWIEKTTVAEIKANELRKQHSEVEKKLADERTKAAEKANKEEEEMLKKRALGVKEEIELFVIQSKNAALLTAAERERLAILTLQKDQKWTQAEIETLITKRIVDGLTPAEEKRLSELIKQDKMLGEQLEKKLALASTTTNVLLPAEQAVTGQMEEQLDIAREISREEERRAKAAAANKGGTIKNVGDVRNLNDTQLDALITRLEASVNTMKASRPFDQGPLAWKGVEQQVLELNLTAARKEEAARRNFAQTQRFFGDDFAQRNVAPDEYARLSQIFNPDQAKRQALDTASIAGTLRNLFPEKYHAAR